MTKIYLAGPSSELDRVKYWAGQLTEAGFDLACKWWLDVEAAGDANPPDLATRRHYAGKDVELIDTCKVFWLLAPPRPLYSDGAFFELGWAIYSLPVARTITSGDTKRSIFCSLTTEFATDDEAFAYAVGLR